jgi:hypothetical protein
MHKTRQSSPWAYDMQRRFAEFLGVNLDEVWDMKYYEADNGEVCMVKVKYYDGDRDKPCYFTFKRGEFSKWCKEKGIII